MPLNKGDRTKWVREAITALAVDGKIELVNRQQAQKWLKEKYGKEAAEVAESTFYNIRRAMLQGRAVPVANGNRPPIATLVAEQQQERAHHPVIPPPQVLVSTQGGIVALVKQLKQIVDKLGKNETKELVDVL